MDIQLKKKNILPTLDVFNHLAAVAQVGSHVALCLLTEPREIV
jgi:hypothetical protein